MEKTLYQIEARISDYHWWFRGRQRLLSRMLPPPDGLRNRMLFDLGCGTGGNLRVLGQWGKAYGVDRDTDALGFCRSKGFRRLLQADVRNTAFLKGNAADLVIATDILEHLDDDMILLREIHRILKAGGIALLIVPAFPLLWGLQDRVAHHKRRYTKRQLQGKINRCGLSAIKVSYFNTILFLPILVARTLLRFIPLPLTSENQLNHPLVNALFEQLLAFEVLLLRYINLPFGVSLVACLTKESEPCS